MVCITCNGEKHYEKDMERKFYGCDAAANQKTQAFETADNGFHGTVDCIL